MYYIHLLGLIAGTLTAISFLPQVVKTWKTKSTKDISLGMFIVFCIGVFLWFIYGICIRALPVIVANLVTLVLASTILVFKIRYK